MVDAEHIRDTPFSRELQAYNCVRDIKRKMVPVQECNDRAST